MDIDKADFAQECIRQALTCGANPHYLLGVAQLRSGIANGTTGAQIGPFGLTQPEWNAHCADSSFDLDFLPSDINIPEAQIAVFAVMARRAFDAFETANGRTPSARELYVQQFPGADTTNFKAALDATAPLVDPAAAMVLDDPQAAEPMILDPDQPVPGGAAPSSFALKAKAVATQEWTFFGQQTNDIHDRTITRGHHETENNFFQRIGTYWQIGTGIPGRDGRSPFAWSAAFISFVMKTSGAGTRFNYSARHGDYISRSITDFLAKNGAAGFWGRRLTEIKPTVGDLVCWRRQPGIDYDHQNNGVYEGHCDIVVDVAATSVTVIGGNVGQSVTRRPLPLDAGGFVAPTTFGSSTVIALMQNRIAQPAQAQA